MKTHLRHPKGHPWSICGHARYGLTTRRRDVDCLLCLAKIAALPRPSRMRRLLRMAAK